MKNRDFVLLLLLLGVGLFIWQLLQKVNTGLVNVSQTDKSGADILASAVDRISTSTADLQSQVATIKQATDLTPVDYLSSYNSILQSNQTV